MLTVKMNKAQLVKTLTDNLEKHKKEHEEAIQGWRETSLKELKKASKSIKTGEPKSLYLNLQKPESFTKEYETALLKLNLTVEEQVELDDEDFAKFVEDNWSWKHSFRMSNSPYTSAANNARAAAVRKVAVKKKVTKKEAVVAPPIDSI